jgi:outer membrane murein-binding lipoprotein Lpp
MKILSSLGYLAVCGLMLCGCVAPQKIQKTQADAAEVQAQSKARADYEQCSQTAMPGTPEHLACRLARANAGK